MDFFKIYLNLYSDLLDLDKIEEEWFNDGNMYINEMKCVDIIEESLEKLKQDHIKRQTEKEDELRKEKEKIEKQQKLNYLKRQRENLDLEIKKLTDN